MLTVHHLGSSQSERIVWLCEELELPYALVRYERDPVTRLAPPEYKALHPFGTAPVITDGDLVLGESAAIVEYILRRYAGGRLILGPDHADFANFLYWFHFANGSLIPSLMMDAIAQKPETMSGGAGARSLGGRTASAFAMIEKRLGAATFFAGEEFTAADIMMSLVRVFERYDIKPCRNIQTYLRRLLERPACRRAMARAEPAKDQRRVAVVTGASSGIGKETAKALAAQGWRVIGIGRDPVRSAAAEKEIRAAATVGQVDMIQADLALMADAARAARDISALTDRIDVLVNNAGGMAKSKVLTVEGYEENFAGNHLGPFLLTTRLLPLLRHAAATAPKGRVRILNTSSDASEMIKGLPWDDLQMLNNFNPGAAYCNAKLANVLFARALSRRLAGDGIVAHAMHPGTVDSNFITHADERTQGHIRTFATQTPVQGADTLIWLATADEPGTSSGGYFYQRKPRIPNPVVDDEAYVERLWAESEKLIARTGK